MSESRTTETHTTAAAGYDICGVARSGGSWFAKVLGSTGVLGRPAEAFNIRYQRRLLGPDYPADRLAQVRWVLTEGATPNGVYGFKIFPIHLSRLAEAIRWTRHLPDLRFIHWRRRDLLRQALSRHRGLQTMQWKSTLTPLGEATYDGTAILEGLHWLATQDARWEVFFARNGIVPMRLVYEDVMADPQGAVDRVAGLMEIDGPAAIDPARIDLAIQRDAETEAWRARFIAEHGDPDRMDEL